MRMRPRSPRLDFSGKHLWFRIYERGVLGASCGEVAERFNAAGFQEPVRFASNPGVGGSNPPLSVPAVKEKTLQDSGAYSPYGKGR